MNKKELRLIRDCIISTQNVIELFDCDNYPYTEFRDNDFKDMFYQLNDMAILISKKIESCDENAETA